jgi:hypothetical protein
MAKIHDSEIFSEGNIPRIALIAAASVVALILLAVFGMRRLKSSSDTLLHVPVISAELKSSRDKAKHPFKTKLSLRVRQNAYKEFDKDALYSELVAIMNELDYAKVSGDNSLDYIKASVKNGLGRHMDSKGIERIYITEFKAGVLAEQQQMPLSSERQFFRGLKKMGE